MSYEVGDTADLTVTVSPADDSTTAVLTLHAPNATSTTPPVTAEATVDGSRTFTASVVLDQAGSWVAVWQSSGIASGIQSEVLTVNTVPSPQAPIMLTGDVGYVRSLIADIDLANPIFSDAQIQLFIDRSRTLKRAAADALVAIAINAALILKVIRTQDLSTDGAKLADSLMKRADLLRKDSDDDDASLDGGFLIEPYCPDERPELVEWRLF